MLICVKKGDIVGRILSIIRSRSKFMLLAAAAVAAAVLLFLLIKGPGSKSGGGEAAAPEQVIEVGEVDAGGRTTAILPGRLSEDIPPGLKSINIPVNFFGDPAVLHEGDRIDIVSIYYDRDTGSLGAETIISSQEIIQLYNGNNEDRRPALSIGDSILTENIGSSEMTRDYGRVLVITFFLEEEQVLRSFQAVESGLLYVALCPENRHGDGRH